jgi:4-diphosphocytidyl-2-C-methyl-D-erythritol kinase
MAEGVFVAAPCKVNFHLQVLGLRGDGYHDLVSLFQQISLADEIIAETVPGDDGVAIDEDAGIPAECNIARRAAELFKNETGIRTGLRISLKKRVPTGAGLGGGSGDAAAVLKALDALFRTELGAERLRELGARLGSDVPFFLGSPCAIVSGRGEIVKPISAREDFALLLLYPGFSVSTAQAYASLDRRRSGAEHREEAPDLTAKEIEERYRGPISRWGFWNSFLPVLSETHPELVGGIEGFYEAGAEFAGLTGSGSVLFGIFSGKRGAEEAERIVSRGGKVFFTFPLARASLAALK